MLVECPNCKTPALWKDNPHRPFCSEHCKNADLGKWADEQYRIPVHGKTPDDVPPKTGEEE